MKDKETVTLVLREDYFPQGTLLNAPDGFESMTAKVVSDPKKMYGQWYFRLLNKMTLGYFFNLRYSYEIKMI